jgi:hypothetical protein
MALGDIPVHRLLVVVVVRQGRVDLPQRQVRMMPLDLLGVPPASDPIQRDHPDLDPGPRDDRFTVGIRLDVGIRHGRHGLLDTPPAGTYHND